jgi:hypothetical protein
VAKGKAAKKTIWSFFAVKPRLGLINRNDVFRSIVLHIEENDCLKPSYYIHRILFEVRYLTGPVNDSTGHNFDLTVSVFSTWY